MAWLEEALTRPKELEHPPPTPPRAEADWEEWRPGLVRPGGPSSTHLSSTGGPGMDSRIAHPRLQPALPALQQLGDVVITLSGASLPCRSSWSSRGRSAKVRSTCCVLAGHSPAGCLAIGEGCLHRSPLAFDTLDLSGESAHVVVHLENLPLRASEVVPMLPSQVLQLLLPDLGQSSVSSWLWLEISWYWTLSSR